MFLHHDMGHYQTYPGSQFEASPAEDRSTEGVVVRSSLLTPFRTVCIALRQDAAVPMGIVKWAS